MSNPHTAEFEKRFTDFYPRLEQIAKHYAKMSGVAYEEFVSALSEEFWLRYQDYDVSRLDNFRSYMNTALSQRARKVGTRKEKKYQQSIVSVDSVIEENDGEDKRMPPQLVAEVDVDEHVTDSYLIDEMLRDEDALTRQIAELKLADPDASDREIARELGIHNSTVKNRLTKVGEKWRKSHAV